MKTNYFAITLILPIVIISTYTFPLDIKKQEILLGINSTVSVKELFFHFFPLNKLEEIERNHIENDKSFQAAINYFQGDEWIALIQNITDTTEYEELTKMLQKYHLNITAAIECIRNRINSYKVPANITVKSDLGPFVQDIINTFEIIETVKIIFNHPDNYESLSQITKQVALENDAKNIVTAFMNLSTTKKMLNILKGMNMDIEPFLNLVYVYLGWLD